MALWGNGVSSLELAANAFKFILSITIKEGIFTLVYKLLFFMLYIPLLQCL